MWTCATTGSSSTSSSPTSASQSPTSPPTSVTPPLAHRSPPPLGEPTESDHPEQLLGFLGLFGLFCVLNVGRDVDRKLYKQVRGGGFLSNFPETLPPFTSSRVTPQVVAVARRVPVVHVHGQSILDVPAFLAIVTARAPKLAEDSLKDNFLQTYLKALDDSFMQLHPPPPCLRLRGRCSTCSSRSAGG